MKLGDIENGWNQARSAMERFSNMQSTEWEGIVAAAESENWDEVAKWLLTFRPAGNFDIPSLVEEFRNAMLAQDAERAGFHSMWFPDHVCMPMETGSAHVANVTGKRSYQPRHDMLDAVGLPCHTGREDVRVVAAAHGRKGVGAVDSGLLQGLPIKADALNCLTREAAAQSTEGARVLVDDGHGMPGLVKTIGEEGADSSTPENDHVHESDATRRMGSRRVGGPKGVPADLAFHRGQHGHRQADLLRPRATERSTG
jgi:hypothetical protein